MPALIDNASDAWKFLVSHGGLEVDGRDQALVEQLIKNLTALHLGKNFDDLEDVPVPDINEVLKLVSVEQLVNAMFVCMGLPFIRMMRDLLDHFIRAEVTEGPEQWKLLLTSETDELEVDLDDFKKWISAATSQSNPLLVPVLKPEMKLWDIWRAFNDVWNNAAHNQYRDIANETDSAEWLQAGDFRSWLPLPPIVARMLGRSDHLGASAALVCEVSSAIQSIVPNYSSLSQRVPLLRETAPEAIRPYIFIEHDRWIESMIQHLAVFERATTQEQAAILSNLNQVLNGVSFEPSQFAHNFEDMTAFLDLPIWKKRYELYSAWLLTQFLAAMDGHSITYHSEDGRLTFGFHATKFATINSTNPPINITGEKRIAAAKLKGHGRKENIQPDYTVWTDDTDRCLLAIEAKHYKRGSSRNFRAALEDYASNLPDARVLLGNYGPIPTLLELDTRGGGMSGRQFAWGNLNPDAPEVVAEFRRTIRMILGDPAKSSDEARSGRDLPRVLGLDVSLSMHQALENGEVQEAIAEIVSVLAITHFAAVDEQLIAFEPADIRNIPFFVQQSTAGGTNLKAAAFSLSTKSSALFFLTDYDGLQNLGQSATHLRQFASGLGALKVRELTLARISL